MFKKFFQNQKTHSQCNQNKRGITVVEILIIISVLVILTVVALPQFYKMRENQVFKNTIADVTSTLHSAQYQSLASKESSEYGVYFQSDKIILFKGNVFVLGSVDNRTINIVSPANISNVTLAGVSANTGELYFKRLLGVPSKTGTITISTNSLSKIITISGTGAISVN